MGWIWGIFAIIIILSMVLAYSGGFSNIFAPTGATVNSPTSAVPPGGTAPAVTPTTADANVSVTPTPPTNPTPAPVVDFGVTPTQ